jgi:hypothetical protein
MRSRLGSSRSAVLVLSALAVVLAVTAGVLWLTGRDAGEMKIPGAPLSDAQAAGQVLASAKQIVKTAQLQDVTGGSAFVSCKNENEPPYQVAIYLNFRLLHGNPVKYLREVGASLVAGGWTPAASTGEHFGQKLTRDGVTAIFYRNVNDANFATMRLYGECRNNADHRNDNPVWREVTDQLG